MLNGVQIKAMKDPGMGVVERKDVSRFTRVYGQPNVRSCSLLLLQ